MGRTMAPNMRADYVLRASLYQQSDGWGVNILLDETRLPAGAESCFGSHVSTPFGTPEKAMQAGGIYQEQA